MTGVAEFVSVLVPSIAVGVGFFLFFWFCRLRKPDIFQPRITAPKRGEGDTLIRNENPDHIDERLKPKFSGDGSVSGAEKTSIDLAESTGSSHLQGDPADPEVGGLRRDEETLDGLPRPRTLPLGMFSWFKALINVSEEEMLATCGLDVIVYMRTLKLCLQLCLISGLYGLVVLIPVYATGEGPDKDSNGEEEEEMMMELDGLDFISLSNLADGSHRLWAPFFSVYITTAAACYLIYKNYSELFQIAQKFHTREAVANYSVMVTDIPGKLQNKEALYEYFSEYPGNVSSVCISKDVAELQEMYEKRQGYAKKLADGKRSIRKNGTRPTHRTGKTCRKVDTIDFCSDNLRITDKSLKELSDKQLNFGPVAFVTFTRLESAAQVMLDVPNYDHDWRKQASLATAIRAPEPRDVRWQALCVDFDKRSRNTILVNIFMALLLLFWTIPVGLLSSIMNLDTLTKSLPFLKAILDVSPVIRGVIQGLLPTLALKIFMALLPFIILWSHMLRFPKSLSHLDLLCTRRYYLCLVLMVFLVVTISGTLFNSLEEFANNPDIGSIVNQIATSLPRQATFFMGYIALGAFSLPIEISRIVPFILQYIFDISWEYDDLPFMEYRINLPNHLLMFTIAIAYTAVAPFMLIWIVIYFAIAYVVWKYQSLFVYFQRFETGGRYWPDIVNRIVTALVLFQVTTFGCVTLRLGAVQGPLVLPSILMIFFCQYRAHKKFRSVFFTSSVRYAKGVDMKRGDLKFSHEEYEALTLKLIRDLPAVSRGTVEIEEKNAIV